MKILLTGATGFVGSAVLKALTPHSVRVLGRSKPESGQFDFVSTVIMQDTDYTTALVGIDVVIHSAARAHIMNDKAKNPLDAFREVNTFGTLNLAQQASDAGVKRFIFISSIKVNGEQTFEEQKFIENDQPSPQDPYGISKLEAELGLLKLSQETSMEVVIIRPPLVYGPGVKANFLSMMKWVFKGVPLPLGAIMNQRSFVALDNLVDLICVCIKHPKAKNQIFMAGDGDDVSTTELLQSMAKALGRPSRLIPVPMRLLEIGAKLVGKPDIAQRLCGSLQVDISKAKDILGWVPPLTFMQGIQKVADTYIQQQDK